MSYTLSEGQSTATPLFFNGANYPYLKERLGNFIQSTDYAIWKVIANVLEILMKVE